MKNRKMLAAMSIAIATNAGLASADNIGAGLAIQKVTDMDSGTALVVNGSKNLNNISNNFSVEGEFTYSLDPINAGDSIDSPGVSGEVTILTLAGYAVYTLPVAEKLSVFGRLGLLYESLSVEACFQSVCASEDDSESGLSYGVGANYQLSETFGLRADYTRIEDDVSHFGVGATFLF